MLRRANFGGLMIALALVLVLDVLALLIICQNAEFMLIALVVGGVSLLFGVASEWIELKMGLGSKTSPFSWDTTRNDLLPSGSICFGLVLVLLFAGADIISQSELIGQPWFWSATVAIPAMWLAGVAIGRNHTIRKRSWGVYDRLGSATEHGTEGTPK